VLEKNTNTEFWGESLTEAILHFIDEMTKPLIHAAIYDICPCCGIIGQKQGPYIVCPNCKALINTSSD
jgi:rubrerythrin